MEEGMKIECPNCQALASENKKLQREMDQTDHVNDCLREKVRDFERKCSDHESYAIIRDLEAEKKRILELVADKYGRKARQEFELALICEFA